MNLTVLNNEFAICRLAPTEPTPQLGGATWWSVTRTDKELSVVCDVNDAPANALKYGPWKTFEVEGPMDPMLTGITAALSAALAAADIPLFAVSTYDTDYVLVPAERLADACAALADAGHRISS